MKIRFFVIFCLFFLFGSFFTLFKERKRIFPEKQIILSLEAPTSTAINHFENLANKVPPPMNVANYYDDLIKKLDKELQSWDSNYLITESKFTFADTADQSLKFYGDGNINIYGNLKVYSYKKRAERSYEINKEGFDFTNEADKKSVDSLQRSWPSDKKYSSINLKEAFDVCYKESKAKGDFYVHDCSLKLGYKTTKQNTSWICHFVEKKEAENFNYLYEAKKSYNCFVNYETGKLTNWTLKTDTSLK